MMASAAASCPSPDRLAAYLECAMPEAESAHLAAHLEHCIDCWLVFTRAERSMLEYFFKLDTDESANERRRLAT